MMSQDVQPQGKAKKTWTAGGRLRFTLFCLLLLWCIGPILLQSSFYPSVVFWPCPLTAEQMKTTDAEVKAPREDFFFENQHHEKLHGILWRTKGARAIVIYHHGNAGNIATRGQAYATLRASGANVFAYDYAGFGKSEGTPSLQGVLDDGMAAYNFVVKDLKFAPADVVNYGESIGSGPACYVAERAPSGGLILQSAIPSIPKAAKGVVFLLHAYPDFIFAEPHMDTVRMIQNVHVPVTIISGAKDVMPVALVKEIYDKANEPKSFVVLKDSHHMAVESREDVESFMQALKHVLSPGATSNAVH